MNNLSNAQVLKLEKFSALLWMNKLVDEQYLEIMVRIRRFINLKKLKININHN